MTVTVGDQRLQYSRARLRTWPQRADLRIDIAAPVGAVGDPVTVQLAGAPLLMAEVTRITRSYRHSQIDATPATLLDMLRVETPALTGDQQPVSVIAPQILPNAANPPRFDSATDVTLDRWTTRPRTAGWAWESLLRTIGGQISGPTTWRYSARDDVLIAETGRDAWPEATPPDPLRNAGAHAVYPLSDLQSGDRLPDGSEVSASLSIWTVRFKRTIVRTETAA